MGKLCRLIVVLTLILVSTFAQAQSKKVRGIVKNSETSEIVPVVSIELVGTNRGTYSKADGEFEFVVNHLPVKLSFSSIGYETQLVEFSNEDFQTIMLKPKSDLGQEVVVSASRREERLLESPVSVERVGSSSIRNAPSASYYDIVTNLKGVDVVTSSLTFKTPTTRGFNVSGSTRFNQIVDGMDNQAPGLNFSVGSVIGLTQLDVESMELLPGASSVLYGPGGMNGTLLINSKNPFRYQGLSLEIKEGVMHVDGKQRPMSSFHDLSFRWGYKVSERFAFKIASQYIKAKDWIGNDYRNYNRIGTLGDPIPGDRKTDPNYDGINVYGDETTADIRQVLNGVAAQAPFLAPYISTLTTKPINVSRTGYAEKDIIDPNTINFKISGSLNFKITERTEAILAGNWGTGNTVYTGSDRYSLKNMKMGQYKLEFVNRNWYLRAYTTQENAGESFNATVTTRLLNEGWKASGGSTGWYAQYGQAFLSSKLNGLSDYDAHQAARAVADVGMPDPKSAQFKRIFDSIRLKPISQGGGLFVDKTDLYQVEGQYNLSDWTGKFADVLIGGNFKRYVLNSEGTLFADSSGTIPINEYGAYIQASRGIGEFIKLTLAGRYDKNENFQGRFTPRATAVIKVAPNNNIRISYQTAYRFPSTQQQWINLDIGKNTRLIGGNESFWDFYKFKTNKVYYLEDLRTSNKLVEYDYVKYKPESVSSIELGYKGLIAGDRLMVDLYGYIGQYKNFLTRTLLVQSKTNTPVVQADTALGNIFSVPVNVDEKVQTWGFGIGLNYKLPENFSLAVNLSSDNLKDLPAGFISFFNSPKYRFNATLANVGFGGKQKRAAFNITYRWQDGFYYNGDFANGNVPAFHLLDAQVSYKLIGIKSVIKLGANNLLNQYYVNAIGNAQVGGLYYISFGYNLY